MKKNKSKRRRAVITGLGVIAANGFGIREFWRNISQGKSGISKISSFDTSKLPVKIAGEVKKFNPLRYLDEKTVSRTARFAQFALIAAKEAMEDAGLCIGKYKPEKAGVIIGSSMGGFEFALDQHSLFLKKGYLSMDTFVTSIITHGAATRAISLMFQTKGPCATFSSTCVASTNAVGYAFNLIRNGKIDIAICGGAETPIHPSILSGFYLGRILSSYSRGSIKVPRPFDLKRNGTVLGEGTAILILEELNHALERKADIYAEIIGYGSTCDAYHIVIPDPEGTQAIRAIKLALKDANISPQDVDYINAHGTGTIRNDQVETLIIKKVFGKRAYKIPISATKAMTGHLLGGCGALEILICALAIKNGLIPPTINYEYPDPQCDLDYVPQKARKKRINVVLSNSFGFGGFNSVVVLRKWRK